MHDRFSRAKDAHTYLAPFSSKRVIEETAFHRTWNVAPGSVQPVICCEGPRATRWGFSPTIAGAKRPMLTSCRLDDKNTATWKTLWRTAHIIVPADGWYEWAVERGKNQPYFVRPADNGPIYLAALSSVAADDQAQAADGFVIVLSGAETGMVDEHSNRPVALDASDAIRWLNPRTTFGMARKMVDESIIPKRLFRWHRVSVGVNSIGNDEPAFNDPLPDSLNA